jgi:hypothetical protein
VTYNRPSISGSIIKLIDTIFVRTSALTSNHESEERATHFSCLEVIIVLCSGHESKSPTAKVQKTERERVRERQTEKRAREFFCM